jgi:hypothetical protein
MSGRRILGVASAALLAAVGLSFIWTTAYYIWTLYVRPGPLATGVQSEFAPIPIVGYIVFYYLLHIGLIPALVLLLMLGIAALIVGYILFRRLR